MARRSTGLPPGNGCATQLHFYSLAGLADKFTLVCADGSCVALVHSSTHNVLLVPPALLRSEARAIPEGRWSAGEGGWVPWRRGDGNRDARFRAC
jgi:hypothetical protein